MSTIEAIVLRRVVTTRSLLTGGALALHNYQLGLAKNDKEIVFRDDVGAFHYFKSDAANELKYSQLGHIHDDRYYTETEINGMVDSLIYESSGVVTSPAPELVYNQDGTMTMPSMVVRIYDNPYYIGIPQKYTVPAKTFTPVDLQDGAIIAHYNSGTPEYRVVDAWNFGAYNLSDAVMVHRSWKAYSDLHSISLGSTGLGAIEKLGLRVGQTMYYWRTGNVGLMLGSVSTPAERTVTVTAANVWAALTQIDVLAFNSSTDLMELLTRNAGVWTSQDVTQWPNVYYNDNAGPVTMSNNKYGVVWVYRTIGNVKEVYLVLGTGEHNTASEAEKESPRSDMDYIVYSHCMLVGRIIFQKGATTATDVQSAFEVTFNSSIVQSHQALSDLQGGQSGQYYHLTQLEWETKILGLGITGRIPLYSAERQITSSILSGDTNGIYPIENGTKALGSTSLRFSELWANTVYENGTSLALKYSPIGHTHDDRYYTESEINTLLSGKSDDRVYKWTSGGITSNGWAKILSFTLPVSTGTTCSWLFNIIKLGSLGGYRSRIGELHIQWRNGAINANFIMFDGTDAAYFGYTGTLATGSLLEVFAYCVSYPSLILEVEDSFGGVIAGGVFTAANPSMTEIATRTIRGEEYNDLRYALLSGANFTGKISATSSTGPVIKGVRSLTGNLSSLVGVYSVDAKTTGDALDGFGGAVSFTFSDSGVTESDLATVYAIRNGADNTGKMVFRAFNSGTAYDVVEIAKDSFAVNRSQEGSYFYGIITGENYARFSLSHNAGGSGRAGLYFGNGTVAVDTNLYRNGSNALKTDGAFAAAGTILSSSDVIAIGALSGASATVTGKTSTQSLAYLDSTKESTAFTSFTSGANTNFAPLPGKFYAYYSNGHAINDTTLTLSQSNMSRGESCFLTIRMGAKNGTASVGVKYNDHAGNNCSSYVSSANTSRTWQVICLGSGFALIGEAYA